MENASIERKTNMYVNKELYIIVEELKNGMNMLEFNTGGIVIHILSDRKT